MENSTFSYLTDNGLQNATFKDLFGNRRVLICSLTRMHDTIARDYIKSIESNVDFYKQHGVDEVCFVSSSAGKIFLLLYQNRCYANKLNLYFDNKTFINELSHHLNKNQPRDFLSLYWNFQVLLNRGTVEHFSECSTTEPVKQAILKNPGLMKTLGQNFINNPAELAVWKPSLLFSKESKKILNLVYYNNLWPNTSLENYLLGQNTNSSV